MDNFESFSEDLIPRIVPQPTLHPVLDMSKPIVPEVSLIFDDPKVVLGKGSQPKSYKEWKQQQQIPLQHQQEPATAKFASSQISATDRKKIVTFDLPKETPINKNVLLPSNESTPIAVCQQLDLSLCEPRKINDTGCQMVKPNYLTERRSCPTIQTNTNNFTQQQKHNQIVAAHQFIANESCTQLPMNQYMNQIPNANQNLNQIPINQNTPNGITLNDVYQLLQNMQSNGQSSSPINNMQNDFNRLNDVQNQHGVFELTPKKPSNNGEPTIKDMFGVILRQQEQLMNIQNQVHMLLERSSHNYIEARHQTNNNNNQMMIGDNNGNLNRNDARTKQVGVMTSLEINMQNFKAGESQSVDNFNTPQKVINQQIVKSCGCMCNCEKQKEPQSSDSGSNDDNFDTSPKHDDGTQTGWTFYGNILNQVNDVLQNTSPISNTKTNDAQSPQIRANIENNFNGENRRHSNIMPNIRSAQIKQVGFKIDDVNISAMTKRITFGSSSNEILRSPADRVAPSDKSMMMNALAMKYLPCDLNNSQSPKFVSNEVNHTATMTNTHHNATVSTTNGHLMSRPSEFDSRNTTTDMSMTSYRYMEKYGLL
ncbi:uncharacterized protein DDB_G0286175-like [Contarinia nasturtii]|uniref:uncharacterized protein DDB_G0286175-like n=1 Tax=Contarinia nasturtii TaxID=265458 RepID=UPI0012D4976B|nr:uncharacterized protein DDB_G0286175-like [Contarinia nasturtii]